MIQFLVCVCVFYINCKDTQKPINGDCLWGVDWRLMENFLKNFHFIYF